MWAKSIEFYNVFEINFENLLINLNFNVTLLKSISTYLADVIGNPFSIKNIADYLNSDQRKTSDHTVNNYINVNGSIRILPSRKI